MWPACPALAVGVPCEYTASRLGREEDGYARQAGALKRRARPGHCWHLPAAMRYTPLTERKASLAPRRVHGIPRPQAPDTWRTAPPGRRAHQAARRAFLSGLMDGATHAQGPIRVEQAIRTRRNPGVSGRRRGESAPQAIRRRRQYAITSVGSGHTLPCMASSSRKPFPIGSRIVGTRRNRGRLGLPVAVSRQEPFASSLKPPHMPRNVAPPRVRDESRRSCGASGQQYRLGGRRPASPRCRCARYGRPHGGA